MADGFQVNTAIMDIIQVKATKQDSLKLKPRDGVEITFEVSIRGYNEGHHGDIRAVVTSEDDGMIKLHMKATRNGSLTVTIETGLQVVFEVDVPQDKVKAPLEDSGNHDTKPHVVVK